LPQSSPPPYDRQRRQSKGCCSRIDRKSDRWALVSLSRDAGQLVQRRPLPEDRSPIISQAIARVPIEVFLGGSFGSAIDWRGVSLSKGADWRVSGDGWRRGICFCLGCGKRSHSKTRPHFFTALLISFPSCCTSPPSINRPRRSGRFTPGHLIETERKLRTQSPQQTQAIAKRKTTKAAIAPPFSRQLPETNTSTSTISLIRPIVKQKIKFPQRKITLGETI
jgi:hypothetical protein